MDEHRLIDRVAGSFLTWARELSVLGRGCEDGQAFLLFFRTFAARHHHATEEDVLFRALIADAETPENVGPLPALVTDHRDMAALLDELVPLLVRAAIPAEDHSRILSRVTRFVEALWHHIDAENSVLFPEAEARLRRFHVRDIPAVMPGEEAQRARAAGVALTERYVASALPDQIRGDGCNVCPNWGVRCEGVEHSWWNDHQREAHWHSLDE